MKIFNATKTAWEPGVRLQAADQVECDDGDLLALVDGEPAVGQFTEWGQREETLKALTRFLRYKVKFQTIAKSNKRGFVRMSGIRAANEYFGTTPPEPPKKRYACRDGRLYVKHPEYKRMIDEITVTAWNYFQKQFPTQAAEHERIVREAIHPDWLIAGTPFTSGIVNDRSALPFHKDAGNLKGTWSMMLALRANTDGGGLQIPELGLNLGIPNHSMTIFEGQSFWHAVTPLVYRKTDAYRYTLVWYVKERIKHCVCRENETERASLASTKNQDAYIP
jgi:hypothetical protein